MRNVIALGERVASCVRHSKVKAWHQAHLGARGCVKRKRLGETLFTSSARGGASWHQAGGVTNEASKSSRIGANAK